MGGRRFAKVAKLLPVSRCGAYRLRRHPKKPTLRHAVQYLGPSAPGVSLRAAVPRPHRLDASHGVRKVQPRRGRAAGQTPAGPDAGQCAGQLAVHRVRRDAYRRRGRDGLGEDDQAGGAGGLWVRAHRSASLWRIRAGSDPVHNRITISTYFDPAHYPAFSHENDNRRSDTCWPVRHRIPSTACRSQTNRVAIK